MSSLANIAVLVVAGLHFLFAFAEMFAWRRVGKRLVPGATDEFLERSATLAFNQGAYNGLLALGLLWGLLFAGAAVSKPVLICLLLVIVGAGLVGGKTASRKIYVVQALPAAITILLVFFSNSSSGV